MYEHVILYDNFNIIKTIQLMTFTIVYLIIFELQNISFMICQLFNRFLLKRKNIIILIFLSVLKNLSLSKYSVILK